MPAGVDAATNIPVIVINGAKPGPKLALVAGSHGTEYASIIALEKLAQSVSPAALSGTLIIVPLINLASFAQKVPHLNPVDGKNMNRMYPGKAGRDSDGESFVGDWPASGGAVRLPDRSSRRRPGREPSPLLVLAADGQRETRRNIARHGDGLRAGPHHHSEEQGPAVPGATSISRFATDLGKPTVIAEAGHAGTTNAEDVDALVQGAENVMRHLKMLPGEVRPVEHPVWIGQITTVRSDQDGIFYPLVVPEGYVQQGMRIGYITDYFGNKLADVITPVSGVVVYICSVPSMKKGDTAAYIGEIASSP